MVDKRRYVSRNPNNPRSPVAIGDHRTGNAAKDGYTVRSYKPLGPKGPFFDGPRTDRDGYVNSPLMDENEAMWGSHHGDW